MGERHIWLQSRRDFWLLRVIAAVISLLLWFRVVGSKKVEITKRVQIEYQLPKDLVIANQAPREVTFRVSGPHAFIKEFEERPRTLTIDLSNEKTGEHEILLREELLDVPLGAKVVSVSQSNIMLRLDRVATRRVPIRADFSGQLPDGLKVIGVTFKPSTVEVRGPGQKLATIDSVPTDPISLSPASLKQEFDSRLNLNDLSGVNVEESSRVVHVVVELEGSLSRKWIKGIEVGLRIHNGSGAKTIPEAASLGIHARPPTVNFLLEGPDRIISKLKPTDIEVWAEIPEMKPGNVRARLDWRLAPELRVVKRSSDWVDISIPPLR